VAARCTGRSPHERCTVARRRLQDASGFPWGLVLALMANRRNPVFLRFRVGPETGKRARVGMPTPKLRPSRPASAIAAAREQISRACGWSGGAGGLALASTGNSPARWPTQPLGRAHAAPGHLEGGIDCWRYFASLASARATSRRCCWCSKSRFWKSSIRVAIRSVSVATANAEFDSGVVDRSSPTRRSSKK